MLTNVASQYSLMLRRLQFDVTAPQFDVTPQCSLMLRRRSLVSRLSTVRCYGDYSLMLQMPQFEVTLDAD